MVVVVGIEGWCVVLEVVVVVFEWGGGSCVLCCGDLEVMVLGCCDYLVCYCCFIKMWVLCE